MAKQSVLVIGATGATGTSIVDGLLGSGNFTVIAGVRPSSISKPEVETLKSRGVEIRTIDLENWSVDQIAEQLKGVDVVISAIFFTAIASQIPLVDACKKAGIRRFVPDDWATACTRGVREFYDKKVEIRDYVKRIGLDHTFIDVGWWMQVTTPFADPSKYSQPLLKKTVGSRLGTGDVKCAVTDRRDIGKFVARIIADERTLNRYVFCWTEEVTLNETVALAERISGRKIELERISVEEYSELVKVASGTEKVVVEYGYSIFIRGDNTIENAKKEEYGGALDARELYPDIGKELITVEQFAKELYSK